MSRGFTLIEAAVAMAITALAVLLLTPVISAGARASARASDPVHAALSAYAGALARDASQAWKYGAPDNAVSQTYTATVYGGATASPMPVTVTVTQTITALDSVTSQINVTVSSASESASATAQLAASAPLPGSQVVRPGLVPVPSPSPTP